MYTLPDLGYSYNALEPYIDAMTMEIHHTKHHQTYINKLNEALGAHPDITLTLVDMLMSLDTLPESLQGPVRNHGGGHYNHSLFWKILTPGGAREPKGDLLDKINESFNSLEQCKELFNNAAQSRFGSGWAWLVKDTSDGSVIVMSTQNQDTPLAEGFQPILGIDVWEHAYYLKYQNRRQDYISEWWNLVNWDIVAQLYMENFSI
jgi:Fe-Mn family superoxide dismutase